MHATEIRLRFRDDVALKAFATVVLDSGREIRGLKVIEGTRGWFVAIPVRKGEIDPATRAMITRAVLDAYERVRPGESSPMGSVDSVRDRVRGVLLGLAAGDRIGGPTAMALRVAESLVACGLFDSVDLFARYLKWWRSGAFDSGPTAARVFALVESGVSPEEAPARVHGQLLGMTAGCNPAHRVAPLAMCKTLGDAELEGASRAEARLTHYHSLTGDVSATIVRLCRLLICGTPWRSALAIAAIGRFPETRTAFDLQATTPFSSGGFAPETLRAAIHFLDEERSFRAAFVDSLEFAGPANCCPVLVGSIGGARWGASQVKHVSSVHSPAVVDRLHAAADALAAGWEDAPRASSND
jgi:ADP-ribosylglycohydrolase/DNA-binding cell septation regulator SpoVG